MEKDYRENKQNDFVEENLKAMKTEYEKPHMTAAQLEKLREKMKEAETMNGKNHNNRKNRKFAGWIAAAALVILFLIVPNTSAAAAEAMAEIPIIGKLVEVVTFRNYYDYETERNMAHIETPEIKPEIKPESAGKDAQVQEKLERTTEEINAEIKEITDQLTTEFKEGLEYEDNYQDITVTSEVLATTDAYFTLKLNCYQGAGSGYQWNYYYTIDLKTGERLKLKDIFKDGADYITPISDSIKAQMQEQMDADENVYYWLHDEMEVFNFKAITDETSFYLNEKDNVVIGFNEGDVAPMYMGAVEFEIPGEVVKEIRK